MLGDWMAELRQASRGLLRTPGFTFLAVVTLGLAIGANAGIFSVVDAVLLDPLPYTENDRLVYIAGTAPGSDLPEEFRLAREFFVQYQEHSELLTDIATFNSFTNTLRAGDRVERVRMSRPSLSMFSTLGVKPLLGRLPTLEDEDQVMVISHRLWTTWFGSDPEILGKTFYAGGENRTVVGVMGEDFWFPNDGTLLWIPVFFESDVVQPGRFGQPLVARLAPGAPPDALAEELTALARQLPDRFGGSANYERLIQQFRPVIRPLERELLGNIAGPLWILLGAVALVLLIACANVASLFMVRAERRQPDLAVRRALGAPRRRLIRSQLAEAAVVAALASVASVAIAQAGVPFLLQAAPANVPRLDQVAIRPTTLLFTLAASVVAALLCGLVPAVRFSAPTLTQLREGGRGTVRRRHWGLNTLVVAQTALALVLTIASALLIRSLDQLKDVDPGYDTRDVFTFQIAPEGDHLQDAPAFARFHTGFMERLAALPGVERVGIVENVPLDEGLSIRRFRTPESPDEEDAGTLLSLTWSAGDYFRTLGIDVLQGRPFTPEDHTTQLGHVLLSRSAADLLWPGLDPVGQRIQMEGQETWETVVGVVDDVRQYGFRQPAEPMVYFPLVGQDPENSRVISSPAYVVKTPRAGEIAPEIRSLVRQVAPSAPMYRTYTMEELAARSMVELSFTALIIAVASGLAFLLGVVGLYGVLSYRVAERTREIGVRMALGAGSRRVRRMVVGQGARVLVLGTLLGAGIAMVASRALGSLLFGIGAFDAVTYLGVAAAMFLVGLLACYLPARRASTVDPMESLRAE